MTTSTIPTWGGRKVTELRAIWATRLPLPCTRCKQPINPNDNWVIGHIKSRAAYPELTWDPMNHWPEHRTCSDASSNDSRTERQQRARQEAAPLFRGPQGEMERPDLPVSLPAGRRFVDDGYPVFDPASLVGVPWLEDLLEKPEDAAWPRHMSPVHPEAVGTYGLDLEEWVEKQGIARITELRWWQRLAGRMQLQYRADGSLCISSVVETGPRRIGKSVRLRSNAVWRMHNGARLFGEQQLVMHTGRDLAIVREIQQKVWSWAEDVADWTVTRANGKEAIENQSGDRWLARAMSAVYGYDVTLGMVDEGWDVAPGAVDEGLEPAAMERLSAQIVLTSTAHRRATPLMPRAIGSALAGMGEEWEVLLLMWAADPRADPGLESTWRSSSPHWSEDRRRLIAGKYEKALRGEADPDANDPDPMEGFRAQYLNIWPAKGVRAPGDPVVDGAVWSARGSYVPGGGPRVIAVESWFGEGVSLAVAEGLPGGGESGRAGVTVEEFATGTEAAARAAVLMAELPVYAYLVGKSLTRDPAFEGAEAVQGRARQVVEDLAQLLKDGAVVHDGSELLAGQVTELRTKRGSGDSLQVVSKGRIDAVKAAVWAVLRARELVNAEPEIY